MSKGSSWPKLRLYKKLERSQSVYGQYTEIEGKERVLSKLHAVTEVQRLYGRIEHAFVVQPCLLVGVFTIADNCPR